MSYYWNQCLAIYAIFTCSVSCYIYSIYMSSVLLYNQYL